MHSIEVVWSVSVICYEYRLTLLSVYENCYTVDIQIEISI